MSLFNSPDKNIYCLDRNTASEQDKKKLLNYEFYAVWWFVYGAYPEGYALYTLL